MKRALKLLEDLGCDPDCELSISFVDEGEMARLNERYRGKKGPTNVLSFSQLEGADPVANAGMLGDVVICEERMRGDADALGYTYDEMTTYLLIHGVLHLLGHTHDQPSDSEAMSAKVEEFFHRFFPANSVPEP